MKRRRAEAKKESKDESAAASLSSAEQHKGSPDLAQLSKGLPSGWQVGIFYILPFHLLNILVASSAGVFEYLLHLTQISEQYQPLLISETKVLTFVILVQAYMDESTKQVYYGNNLTLETSWERPTK